MYVAKPLATVGLACLKADTVLHLVYNLVDSIGLGRRRFLQGDKSDSRLNWVLEEVLETSPELSQKDWAELVERLRRVHGELSKCESLIARVKAFPRNTTKEPQ